MSYKEEIIGAKYHMSVCKRMVGLYDEYPEKRVLVGVINEAAKAAGKLVRAFLIFDNTRGSLKTFKKKVAPKYLDYLVTENIIRILNVQNAQKKSPIEFSRGEKIILMIDGKYRILTVDRLKEFVKSIDETISTFFELASKKSL